jgi:hypothetical protein
MLPGLRRATYLSHLSASGTHLVYSRQIAPLAGTYERRLLSAFLIEIEILALLLPTRSSLSRLQMLLAAAVRTSAYVLRNIA